MQKHYHVTIGSQGGYLPDTNSVFTSKRDAMAYMESEADDIMDGYDEEQEVSRWGSAHDGIIGIEDGTLGAVIELSACTESDCDADA